VDIFITGNLNTCAPALAEALLADGHHIVASTKEGAIKNVSHKHFVAYDMTVGDPLYAEIFTSHSFDAIIHITDQAGLALNLDEENTEHINTAMLESALYFSKKTGVEKFILISSIDIFGTASEINEDEPPQPKGPWGQVLLNAERLCGVYADKDLSVSIIRIPLLYGPEENFSILSDLIRQSQKKKNVPIPFGQHTHCNFLHVSDLTSLVRSIIEGNGHEKLLNFNLGTEDINYSFLSQQLNIYFPKVTYQFPEKIEPQKTTNRKITVNNAVQLYDWKPQHSLIEDLPSLAADISKPTDAWPAFSRILSAFASKFRPFLVWMEVTFGAFLMHMVTLWTNTIIEFKVIDYRLIYVVLIGSIHGLLFGIIAAILAAASAVISWNNIGLDFALLIYNVENWIPFTVYFLAGAVTGYLHDKQKNDLQFEKNQTALIHEKYSFLYSLYNEISTIKNRLREQLVGYRDSFGRFFRVANELNELDEDNIFFKALEVLEDLMKNNQIAIYSIESSGHYGRLQVSSKSLTRDIPKSMRLDDYSEAVTVLRGGDVFQNKDLIANYPSYIAPIMNTSDLIGLVIIWEANFEQFNMYYYNLFKVITGLIQSALVRAATFENARFEQLFLPGTRIMRPESFRQTFAIRNKMRRNKVSEFQILRILREGQAWETVYEKISSSIRSEDVVGILEDEADACFIILSNAAAENVGMIQDRMKNNGFRSEHIAELEMD